MVHLNPDKCVDVSDELINRSLIELIGDIHSADFDSADFDSDNVLVRTDFRRYPESLCSHCNQRLDNPFLKLSIETRDAGTPRDHMLRRGEIGFYTSEISREISGVEDGFTHLSRDIHQAGGHISLLMSAEKSLVSVFLPESGE